MKIEDIKVGETYVGRSGKPRTVVAFDDGYYFDVSYHTGDPKKVSKCWWATFKGWAKYPLGEEQRIREDRVKEHAVELLEALEAIMSSTAVLNHLDTKTQLSYCDLIAKCMGAQL